MDVKWERLDSADEAREAAAAGRRIRLTASGYEVAVEPEAPKVPAAAATTTPAPARPSRTTPATPPAEPEQ